ncbi:ribosome production factor 2 homolog [Condylostylus longicornis]|uniref:ribosome production factor 2 homolog n=1 Tax=Condylostylus longicornis TaxID=2530218 RepID=UPI00244DC3AB|nr:ribosome production factor 2 homolog [Condylostylus longicornis]
MSLLRIRKPKTRKGKKVLVSREPQVLEPAKNVLFLEGRKCSGAIKTLLKDMYQLKKPLCKMLNRNNDISPFEDTSSLEFLTMKNECGIFMMGSTSKKRPDNLVLGRIFENELLDMVELGIKHYQGLADFPNEKIGTCVKPCLIFNGPKWAQTEELRRLKNLFIDLFYREKVEAIRLQGIEHALSFTLLDDMTVCIRSYKILLKKSGQKTPRIELTEIGPSVDFSIRRTKIASDDLYKQSRKQPKVLAVKKKKNLTTDALGTTHGRVHIDKQKIQKIQTRKVKALKKTPEERKEERKKKKNDLKAAKLDL